LAKSATSSTGSPKPSVHLQQHDGALTATLIVAGGWALWHVPMFFYVPTYVQLGPAGVLPFAIGLLLGATPQTWLYNSSGGSIFAVAMRHALYDFL
jgi:uncharacterized protein